MQIESKPGVSLIATTFQKSSGSPFGGTSGRPTVVDFVAVRAIKIHKPHQVA
jgi:hypothetical protein